MKSIIAKTRGLFIGFIIVLILYITQVCASATQKEDFDCGMDLIRQGATAYDKTLVERGVVQLKKAANAGHAEAAYGLHYVYGGYLGQVFPKDEDKQCFWVEKAAKMKFVEAYFGAASCAMRGYDENDPAILEKRAVPWLRKIAAEGKKEDAEKAKTMLKDFELAIRAAQR